jgi:predicted Zn-dependent protease
VSACETVPITGHSQLNLLSEPDEIKMGIQAYQEVTSKAKVSSSSVQNAQVNRVAQRITGAVEKPALPWEVKVIEDNQANAFALPGGKIAVYTGILPIARDDAGLPAVIGHEVGHVIARHSAERVSQQMVAQGLGGALVSGVLGTDPQTSAQVAGLFAQGLLLPWGRRQESEADHIGLILMASRRGCPRPRSTTSPASREGS